MRPAAAGAGEQLRDLDLANGRGLIRIEAAALVRLGGRPTANPLQVVDDHIETITAIVNYKRAIGEVEEVGGKRVITISAADIDAA